MHNENGIEKSRRVNKRNWWIRINERFLKNVEEFHKTGKYRSAEHTRARVDLFDKIRLELIILEMT